MITQVSTGASEPSPSSGGVLVLAATPIGRVADAPPRLAEELAGADVVAAEDTRRLKRLCGELGVSIGGRVVSYFEGNEAARTPVLVEALESGERVLVVTDAGMPSVSDPGFRLVAAAVERGIARHRRPRSFGRADRAGGVRPAGRPVLLRGLPAAQGGGAGRRLAALRDEPRTMVFFEAPHRTAASLAAMADAFGADRRGAVCRELTKTHEEVRRGRAGRARRVGRRRCPRRGHRRRRGRGRPGRRTHRRRRRWRRRWPRRRASGRPARRRSLEVARRAGRAQADGVRRGARAQAVSRERTHPQPRRRRPDRSRPPAPEPLPHPVVDNHCHLDIADGPDGSWLPVGEALDAGGRRRGDPRSCRSAATCPAPAGPSRPPRRTTRWSPGSRCTPTRRRVLGARAAWTRRWPRSRRWRRRATGSGPSARPGWTTSAPARTAAPRSTSRSAAHIDLAKRLDRTLVIHDRDAHDDVLRILDEEGVPTGCVMHCFSGDADFARRAWTAAPGCRSPAP